MQGQHNASGIKRNFSRKLIRKNIQVLILDFDSSFKKPKKMADWRPSVNEQLSDSEKLKKKMKKEPFIPIGFFGLLCALGYGAYAYKNRGPAFTTSRYLMSLRVAAQSMVVGSIVIGLGVSQLQLSQEDNEKNENNKK